MPRLYLIRHAKSCWSYPHLKDKDRPLNARGLRDAPLMGQHLAAAFAEMDSGLVLVSSARRTQDTWSLMRPHILACWPPLWREEHHADLYHASPKSMIRQIEQRAKVAKERHKTPEAIVLVGHNEGLLHLALRLSRHQPNDAMRMSLANKFPTCAYVCFSVPQGWKNLDEQRLQLCEFQTPKGLQALSHNGFSETISDW